MSDANITPELLAALQAQLAGMQQQQPAAATGWTQSQQSAPAGLIQGAAVPVKLDTPLGSVRVYLSLPAQCTESPQALLAAIESLHNMGLPIDAWQPKESGNWGSNGGGYGGRGGYGNRGGYGRGGYGRGGW